MAASESWCMLDAIRCRVAEFARVRATCPEFLRIRLQPSTRPTNRKGAPMHRYSGVAIVLLAPLLLCAGEDDVRKELKALSGKWKAVALEASGKTLPKEL